MKASHAFWLLLAVGCSKKEAPERKDPWLATPSARTEPSTLTTRYRVEKRCETRVELKAKEATPRGTFRVCRGELDVDLVDLEKTRGKIAIDVASLEMIGDDDAGSASSEWSRTAHNWLDVGASRPEAERERLRWATFEVTSIEDASAERACDGKRAVDPVSAEDPDAGRGEQRTVKLTAKGKLELHGVRVDVSVPIEARFHFSAPATPDQKPDRIDLEARRSLSVPLAAHSISPRNSEGVFVAEDSKLLGVKVGRDARVLPSCSLRPDKP